MLPLLLDFFHLLLEKFGLTLLLGLLALDSVLEGFLEQLLLFLFQSLELIFLVLLYELHCLVYCIGYVAVG